MVQTYLHLPSPLLTPQVPREKSSPGRRISLQRRKKEWGIADKAESRWNYLEASSSRRGQTRCLRSIADRSADESRRQRTRRAAFPLLSHSLTLSRHFVPFSKSSLHLQSNSSAILFPSSSLDGSREIEDSEDSVSVRRGEFESNYWINDPEFLSKEKITRKFLQENKIPKWGNFFNTHTHTHIYTSVIKFVSRWHKFCEIFLRGYSSTIRLTFAVRYSGRREKKGRKKEIRRRGIKCSRKFADKSGTDVGTTAQALRDIVERVVEEARRLPGFGSCDGSGRIQDERNGAENSYEEVLATTILNKVVETYSRRLISRGRGGAPLSPERVGLRFTEFVESARESMSERWWIF